MWLPLLASGSTGTGDHKGRPYKSQTVPTFIGLDLAWTSKNESGICWLEGDSRENLRCTRLEVAAYETEDLAEEVASANPAVVTIDAPVLYTPERWAEAEIARRFNKYKCPAHSSHMAYSNGFTAGFDLGQALEERGYNLDPQPLLRGWNPSQSAVEVYPHTIHVRLFGLSERLPYKRKKGRDTPYRRRVMQKYQELLTALLEKECPLVLDHPEVQRTLDPAAAQVAVGKSLQRLDDGLDGITCAVAAWLMWKNPDGWEALGDENGYIVVPTEANTPDVVTLIPDFSLADESEFPPDTEAHESGVAEEAPTRFRTPPEPRILIESKAPGVEVQVSKLDDESTWEVRVRLEGEDLSRVITVVERLE